MSTNLMTRGASKSCGCGGRAPCSCQSARSSPSAGGVLTRPVFFAGQLLTEDDLQRLSDYVARKSRLHNRHLFGSGVVCGLSARPSPCEPRNVIIAPGYALDDCGNDIVIDAPVTLDIFQMIRDLRSQIRGGFDCGDPCSRTKPRDPNGAKTSEPSSPPVSTGPAQTYELRVRHAEISSGFVSAYETEPCGEAGCYPSFLEEGHQFELRCPPEDPNSVPPPETLARRIESCLTSIGGGDKAKKIVDALGVIRKARAAVAKSVALTAEVVSGTLPQDTEAALAALDQPASLNDRLQTLHEVLALLFRARLVEAPDANEQPLLAKVGAKLGEVENQIKGDAAIKAAHDMLKGRLDLLTSGVSTLWKRGTTPEKFDERALVSGEEVTLQQLNEALGAFHEVSDTLVKQQRDGVIALEAKQIVLLSAPPFGELGESFKVGLLDEDVWPYCIQRARILFGVLSNCYCDALGVPCADDDDPGVLLATLTVDFDKCEVISVCNQARAAVLSGPAIRYWLAQIEEWFDASLSLCCPDPGEEEREKNEVNRQREQDIKDWTDAPKNVTRWPTNDDLATLNPPREATKSVEREEVSQALMSMAGFTGRDPAAVATGLSPFRIGGAGAADGAAVARLTQQVNALVELDLSATITSLRTADDALRQNLESQSQTIQNLKQRVDELEKDLKERTAGPAGAATKLWAWIVTRPLGGREADIRAKLRERLTEDGWNAIKEADKARREGDQAHKDAGKAGILSGVAPLHLAVIDTGSITDKVKEALTNAPSNINEIATKQDAGELAKHLGEALRNPTVDDMSSLAKVIDVVRELELLIDLWPEEADIGAGS